MARRLHVHDPGGRSLRRAARATLLVPSVFAITLVGFDDVYLAIFASFGVFAPLVFADFGGLAAQRALANVATTIVGGALVVAGTALSNDVAGAAIATLAVVFAVRFAGSLGGNVEAAGAVLSLSFVLAAAISGPMSQADSRLLGWLAGGAIATLGTLVLWPAYELPALRRRASGVCRALAATVRDPTRAEEVPRALKDLRVQYLTQTSRPSGPGPSDRAFQRLADELIRISAYVGAVGPDALEGSGRSPDLAADALEDRRLRAAIAETLETAAACLEDRGDVPDLQRLEEARIAFREATAERAGAELRDGRPAAAVLDGLDAGFRLRVAGFAAFSIAANAMVVAGMPLPPEDEFEVPPKVPEQTGGSRLWATVRLLGAQASLSSPRMRDALRGGAALGLAVLVAGLADVGHGFWVVLATLAVLRSNAQGTGRTAVQAILGTTAGFAVGSALMVVVGDTGPALWVALPVAVFLAAYAPAAIHFLVGQGAFTVFVVVLFNLIEPEGWTVGLVRLEDVAIGVAVSLVVGILFWPRGARTAIRSSASAGLRAGVALPGRWPRCRVRSGREPPPRIERRSWVRSRARLRRWARTWASPEPISRSRRSG